jgi:AcrR family transcriptional regulator
MAATDAASVNAASPAERPMRADARRNAERLVEAAREVFGECGPDASLDEIARRAGVGIGTLYRHFPTRRALVEAVFRDKLESGRVQADELLERLERYLDDPNAALTAGDALALWLRAQLRDSTLCRGLAASAMITMLDDDENPRPDCEAMRASGAALLQRAQRDGEVRADTDIDDLLRMVNAIGLATEDAPDAAASADRLFELMIAGVRTPSGG